MVARGGFLKLLDAYVAIGGDTSGLDKAVDQAAAKAVAAGGRIESALSPRRVFGALAAASGAAFGIMLTGANQLDAATRKLQANTGMTAAEAERAQHALAGMYRNNLQGFDAIGDAMERVHNDLGLTGDAADAATEKFLKFSTATGQDAGAAVASFDDILDAWGLTAADAGGLMDKLIASHQKYGGVISESQSALAAMAPAMQAANMTIDDGIALLNLFNAAGIDAAKAPQALARAVKQLKPGEDLNDLIRQISAIENPILRGQRAMEIFGGRAIDMSAAFRPGIESLDDFRTSTEENTRAMEDMADTMESGWGNRLQLILKNVGGWLADVGTQFGPLLMVAAGLGPKLTAAIGSGLGGIAGFFGPKLLAMIAPQAEATGLATGKIMGNAFGASLPTAAAVAAIAVPVTIILAAQGPVADFLGLSGKQTGPAGTWEPKLGGPFKVPATVELVPGTEDATAEAFRQYLRDMQERGLEGLDYGEWKAAGMPAGKALAQGVAEGAVPALQSAVRRWRVPPDAVAGIFSGTMDGVRAAAKATGAAGMEALAAGITAERQKPLDAFGSLKEMLKNAMTPTQEAFRIAGQLTSKELAEGMRSQDPVVRAQAIAVRRMLVARLEEIKTEAGTIGGAAMKELEKGIGSENPAIRRSAELAKDAVVSTLAGAKSGAYTAGAATARSFIEGMLSKMPSFLQAALRAQLHAAGVPGYAMGAWFVPATQLATVHAGEMIIPAAPSAAVRAGQATVTAQGVVADAWHALARSLTLRDEPTWPGAATGMPYVPRDMLLNVHQREAILTTSQADTWRSGRPGGDAREQHINIEHVEIRDAHDEMSLIAQLRFLAAAG